MLYNFSIGGNGKQTKKNPPPTATSWESAQKQHGIGAADTFSPTYSLPFPTCKQTDRQTNRKVIQNWGISQSAQRTNFNITGG